MVAMEELRFTGRSQSDPERAPAEKKKYAEEKFFLTIAPRTRVCHEIASFTACFRERMHLKNDRPFVFRSRNFTHRVDIAVFKHKKRCVRSERSIGHRWKNVLFRRARG